jgi:hypothetical protein
MLDYFRTHRSDRYRITGSGFTVTDFRSDYDQEHILYTLYPSNETKEPWTPGEGHQKIEQLLKDINEYSHSHLIIQPEQLVFFEMYENIKRYQLCRNLDMI